MSYRLDPRMEGDGFYIDTRTAASDLGARKLVYLDSNGKWDLADEDSLTSLPVLGITKHAILSGKKGQVLVWGIIGDSSWTWTLGNAVYVSSTAGELTQTKPSTQEYPHIQSIAIPIETTLLMFNPAFKSDVLNDVVMLNDYNWEDLRFPAGAVRLGSAQPAVETLYKGGLVLAFPTNTDTSVYLTAQLPHSWEEGTNIICHMHWTIPTSGAGGGAENVKFDLTHSWANLDAAFPAESTLTFTQDVQNTTLDTHLLNAWTALDATAKTFSSMLIISLTRDVAVANDYADDVYLTEFDIHFRRNRLGTFGESPP